MKIAVMAAGGVGGYYGALLARDGHDVTFLARGAHLQALRADGLVITSPHGDFAIRPAKATDNPAEVGEVDWVIFAVKTYDTDTAARAIRPLVGARTTIVTFQNGVDAPEQIGAIVGRDHVLAAPTQIVSNIAAPGVIAQKSAFRISIVGEVFGQGVTPRVEQFVAALAHTGVDATAVPDARKPLWHKLVLMASVGGLSALARTEPYALLQLPAARATLRAAMEEVYAVGIANGVPMDADIAVRQYEFALKFQAGQKPSLLLDLEQGKRLEIEALSGAVVRLGAAKGVATPVHQTIYVALQMDDERAKRRV